MHFSRMTFFFKTVTEGGSEREANGRNNHNNQLPVRETSTKVRHTDLFSFGVMIVVSFKECMNEFISFSLRINLFHVKKVWTKKLRRDV